jgi:1-acyl-sn-glycerol-3-phosphate acyltransferase
MSQPELAQLKEQVYRDPRPAEHFARFHERTRTKRPNLAYDVVRVVMSLIAWTLFRARGLRAENAPAARTAAPTQIALVMPSVNAWPEA